MTRAGAQPLGAGFGRLFGANLSSSLADGIARVAAPLLAVRLTDDPLLIAGVAAVGMIPWLLFAILSGMVIDRLDRRVVMALASGIRTALAVLLFVLVATGALTIWWLYVILFVYGIGETLYDGAIRAVIPSLVPRADLHRANGRIEASEQVVQNFAAAPLTSLLFGFSALIPLGINGAAFALALGLALALPLAAAGRVTGAPITQETFRVQFAAGLKFLLGSRMLMTLWGVSTFFAFFFSAGTAIVPLYAIDTLGLPEELFGVMLLLQAVGAILGSLVVGRLKSAIGTGWTIGLSCVFTPSPLLLAGLVPELWAFAVALFLSSASMTLWNVLVVSLRQAAIPTRLLGRVHGTWRTVHWGAIPLGSLVGGLLGRIDVLLPFLVGGGVGVVAGLALLPVLRKLPEPEEL